MPDEAREVVFPKGVPIHTMQEAASAPAEPVQAGRVEIWPSHGDGVEAEGDLTTEKDEIEKQAEQARDPEGGANLLKS